jgi:chromosome segregation ATPase
MSNRNPKNLRDFVDKSKLDYEFDRSEIIEDTLKNLKNLSHEEKTELGMLKSRIDEQSRLIMTLKQRADDFIRKNMMLEKLNQELIEKNEKLGSEIKLANEKYAELLDRFNYLGNNHEQLIVIKDEYKKKNEELLLKNKQLLEKIPHLPDKEEFEREKDRLNKENLSIQDKLSKLTMKFIEMENKYLAQRKDSEKIEKQLHDESNYLRSKNEQIQSLNHHLYEMKTINEDFVIKNQKLEEQVRNLSSEIHSLNEKQIVKLHDLNKEKEDLYVLCEKLKKELKTSIDSQMSMEKNYANLAHELSKAKEMYSKNSLQNELKEAQRKYTELEKQFDAYKKHSHNLLEKEREMNNKLKNMLH